MDVGARAWGAASGPGHSGPPRVTQCHLATQSPRTHQGGFGLLSCCVCLSILSVCPAHGLQPSVSKADNGVFAPEEPDQAGDHVVGQSSRGGVCGAAWARWRGAGHRLAGPQGGVPGLPLAPRGRGCGPPRWPPVAHGAPRGNCTSKGTQVPHMSNRACDCRQPPVHPCPEGGGRGGTQAAGRRGCLGPEAVSLPSAPGLPWEKP